MRCRDPSGMVEQRANAARKIRAGKDVISTTTLSDDVSSDFTSVLLRKNRRSVMGGLGPYRLRPHSPTVQMHRQSVAMQHAKSHRPRSCARSLNRSRHDTVRYQLLRNGYIVLPKQRLDTGFRNAPSAFYLWGRNKELF